MESSTSLYDLRRPSQRPSNYSNNGATTSGGMRTSASQAYFDRYPERKGQGPYIPSPKLTPSFRSRRADDSGEEATRSIPDQRKPLSREREDVGPKKEKEKIREQDDQRLFDLPPLTEYWVRRIEPEAAYRSGYNDSPTPKSTIPPSSSTSSNVETALLGNAIDRRRDDTSVANAAASRSPSGYPSTISSIKRRTSQNNLSQGPTDSTRPSNSKSIGDWKQESVQEEVNSTTGTHPAPASTSVFKRQLKAQQSMPNIRSVAEKRHSRANQSNHPWPVSFREGNAKSDSYKAARDMDRTGSTLPRTTGNVLSIDEIIKRHSPSISMSRNSSGDYGFVRQPQRIQSIDTRRMAMMESDDSDVDSDGSGASYDSIEKEIRQSLRKKKWKGKVDHRVKTQLSQIPPVYLSPSPSASTIAGKKKPSPGLMDHARRLRTMSINNSSQESTHQSLKKGDSIKKTFTSSSSGNLIVPTPASPSPSISSFHSSSLNSNEQDLGIRDYLRSKRLTSLMTLSKHPYQGHTVSFADVGDEDGHPVFVFLGLGAVRYLVGLYDEMASVLNLRLICIDRWGLGKTDDLSAEKRGVLEWSSVVAEVADRLQIRRFSVLAHSAGAPYAMATCLMHEHRIAGPVHLLAPWVSPTIESGYKWLKYVPDGVIKTAQAADWKMQAWKLGLTKTPAKEEECESNEQKRSSSATIGSKLNFLPPLTTQSFDSDPLTDTSTRTAQLSLLNIDLNRNKFCFDDDWSGTTTDTISTSALGSSPPTSINLTLSGAESSLFGGDGSSTTPRLPSDASMKGRKVPSLKENSHFKSWQSPSSYEVPAPFSTPHSKPLPPAPNVYSHRPSFERSASSPWNNSSSEPNVPANSSSLDLTTALLRASHSESLRGGGTNDLLVILGRSSQKPWGFTYTDIGHDVVVWHGDKDERISLSSILWMEREMKHCRVNLVKGANHGLMTNVSVVIEALESISTYRDQ